MPPVEQDHIAYFLIQLLGTFSEYYTQGIRKASAALIHSVYNFEGSSNNKKNRSKDHPSTGNSFFH